MSTIKAIRTKYLSLRRPNTISSGSSEEPTLVDLPQYLFPFLFSIFFFSIHLLFFLIIVLLHALHIPINNDKNEDMVN